MLDRALTIERVGYSAGGALAVLVAARRRFPISLASVLTTFRSIKWSVTTGSEWRRQVEIRYGEVRGRLRSTAIAPHRRWIHLYIGLRGKAFGVVFAHGIASPP